jgi:hypothetical protein
MDDSRRPLIPLALLASAGPRGALFQEDAISRDGMAGGWLMLGVWVVSALVTGGIAASVALRKGRSPIRWYVIGGVGSVFGIALAMWRRPADSIAIPPGLAKIPSTPPPARCPGCGASSHPSARVCASCGGGLTPSTSSDLERL